MSKAVFLPLFPCMYLLLCEFYFLRGVFKSCPLLPNIKMSLCRIWHNLNLWEPQATKATNSTIRVASNGESLKLWFWSIGMPPLKVASCPFGHLALLVCHSPAHLCGFTRPSQRNKGECGWDLHKHHSWDPPSFFEQDDLKDIETTKECI